MAQRVRRLPTMQETWVRSLGWEDPLEKEMATHSSTLAWKSHGRRSLVDYGSWGSKESDMTEHAHTAVTVPTIFTSINFSYPFSFASILCFLYFLYFMILQLESEDKFQVLVWLALVFVRVYVLSRFSCVCAITFLLT